MNHSDSKKITKLLERRGIAFNPNKKRANLIIINSCSVRQSAMDRIYGQINELQNNSTNKKQIITVTGCILETDEKKLKERVGLVFNIKNPRKLINLLKKITNPSSLLPFPRGGLKVGSCLPLSRGRLGRGQSSPAKNEKLGLDKTQKTASALISISNGCNNYCSYCVVPYVRGPEIHRPAKEIIYEVKKAIERGAKEIWLLGQNVNSYESRIKNQELRIKNINFPKLLKMVNDLPGDFWIKFISSHPKDMSDELIETIAKCDKACKYIHLPIQSGDNAILKKMNRRYTVNHYKNLVKKIRAKITNAAISTDIIVGFPTETKKQFANTAKLMREIKFDMAYLSQYSPRTNTAASALNDNITKQEKKQREKILNDILRKTALQNNKKYIGKTIKVLIEKIDKNIAFGKTATHKTIKIKIDKKIIYKIKSNFISVEITDAGSWGLLGEIISN